MNIRLASPAVLLSALLILTISTTSVGTAQTRTRDASGSRDARPPTEDVSRENTRAGEDERNNTPVRRFGGGRSPDRGTSQTHQMNPPRVDRSREGSSSGNEMPVEMPDEHPEPIIIFIEPMGVEVPGRCYVENSNVPRLDIPIEYIPPLGMYRLWFSDTPPELQPRVTAHFNMRRSAPAGTRVMYRPFYDRDNVYLHITHWVHDGLITDVFVFNVHSGFYVRRENPLDVRY